MFIVYIIFINYISHKNNKKINITKNKHKYINIILPHQLSAHVLEARFEQGPTLIILCHYSCYGHPHCHHNKRYEDSLGDFSL